MIDSDVTAGCRMLRNVGVPMRDGVKLATSVVLPKEEGRYPTVMVRTSYCRVGHVMNGLAFAKRGYAYVAQDCRGRFDSDGEWYPFTAEAADGVDTLEWIARQPWSDGKVGMYGASYEAGTQLLSAPEGNPHLNALIPMFMTGDLWRRAYYADGAFSLALNLIWLCFEVPAKTSDSPMMPAYDMAKLFRHLPLMTADQACGYEEIPFWRDYVRHSTHDDYWRELSVHDKFDRFRMPVLLIGGWYDYYPKETLDNFVRLVKSAPTPELARSHRVMIGPWGHGWRPSSRFGDLDFGPQSLVNGNELSMKWFDRTLKGMAADDDAPIRLFVMGANEWRDEDEWPLARTQYVDYYLHSAGAANSLHGDGSLSPRPPGDEPGDGFTYDPDNPVPTHGGNHSIGMFWEAVRNIIQPGPLDQRPIERRDDVLVYTTEPLDEDTEVTGPIILKLFAASSAPDTDFVGRLADVYPDGRAINVTEGVIRARFRERDWQRPKLIEPGVIYEYTIDLQVTANVFKRGHRIRLDVTSSNFPLWDRNPNTGHELGVDADVAIARQTIHHDADHPSHLVLPIVKN